MLKIRLGQVIHGLKCIVLSFKQVQTMGRYELDMMIKSNNQKQTLKILSYLFFLESFNLWRLLLMITFYHQTKIPISF